MRHNAGSMPREKRLDLIDLATGATVFRPGKTKKLSAVHPASVGGAQNQFATVWDVTTGDHREYAWETVETVLTTTKQFAF